MLIRQAKEYDRKEVLAMAEAFNDQVFTSHKLDMEHANKLFTVTIRDHVLLIAEEKEEVMGCLVAHYSKHPLNPNLTVLMELMWWVKPEHRGSGAGGALLHAYTTLKLTDITTMSLLRNSPDIEGVLKSAGFQVYEKTYARFNDAPEP